MKRPRVGLCLLSIALAGGCAERYRVVDVPFCASEDLAVDGKLEGQYAIAAVGGNTSFVGPFMGTSASPQWTFRSAKVRMALLECKGDVGSPPNGWAKDFDDAAVPSLCPAQSVVFNQMLEVAVSERGKGLGFDGDLVFPKVALACDPGTLVQRNDYTFGQIMTDFVQAVDRYVEVKETMPTTMAELKSETKQPALPPDPWGTELAFEGGATIRLTSAGPDKTLGTPDDIEVLSKQADQSTHVLSFKGADYSPTGDYRAFLGRQGVE
ncbi:MAG: hypothetical protein AAF721_34365 [Myxococcota bacterium]